MIKVAAVLGIILGFNSQTLWADSFGHQDAGFDPNGGYEMHQPGQDERPRFPGNDGDLGGDHGRDRGGRDGRDRDGRGDRGGHGDHGRDGDHGRRPDYPRSPGEICRDNPYDPECQGQDQRPPCRGYECDGDGGYTQTRVVSVRQFVNFGYVDLTQALQQELGRNGGLNLTSVRIQTQGPNGGFVRLVLNRQSIATAYLAPMIYLRGNAQINWRDQVTLAFQGVAYVEDVVLEFSRSRGGRR
jgi:hypothetical protein